MVEITIFGSCLLSNHCMCPSFEPIDEHIEGSKFLTLHFPDYLNFPDDIYNFKNQQLSVKLGTKPKRSTEVFSLNQELNIITILVIILLKSTHYLCY